MNGKDLIISFGFALALWFTFNYVFFDNSVTDQQVSSFVAPKEYKPLNTEVDFLDSKRPAPAQLTDIETDWSFLSFSTDAASLESIDFKRENSGTQSTIRALFPVSDTEKEERCFLVGLDEKTPYYYTRTAFNNNETDYQLTYVTNNDDCTLEKMFIIDKHRAQIDIVLTVTPKESKAEIRPRIFYPAPLMPEIRDADTVSSIVIDMHGTFSKKNVGQLDTDRGWFKPQLFGSDSRYFIYSFIADTDNFVQRAYYKLENRDRLFSILEGPVTSQKTSWRVSFYCGPKDLDATNLVDNRLEKTFDHGIFALLAKLLLQLIKWFYSLFHSYGLAIVAVTLLIQLLLLPLSIRNGEEKFKKQQAVYQQKLAIIKQRFKDQPDKLAVEHAELMRTDGMPSLGCIIPMLLQIPIFFALNRVLSTSFELYQAPMLWIRDLSLKDPYYILPLIVVLAMCIPDGKVDSQQRMSKIMMAVIFGAFMSSLAAGLVLYFAASRVFGLVQSRVLKHFNVV